MSEASLPLKDDVQVHYDSAVKERDWSLYLFFRILPNDEAHATIRALRQAKRARDYEQQSLNAPFLGAEVDHADVSADKLGKLKTSGRYGHAVSQMASAPFLTFLRRLLGTAGAEADDRIAQHFGLFGFGQQPTAAAAGSSSGDMWFRRGLVGVCVHEYLRYQQGGDRKGLPLLRAGSAQAQNSSPPATPEYSNAAVNLAFTYSGLGAIKKLQGKDEIPLIHPVVLESFPEAFKQGMAARAGSLGDTGRSAPEYWDGELGKRTIHGLLTAYFEVGETRAAHWDKLRAEVEAYNAGDAKLRHSISLLFRPLGFEVLHIELGEDPYDLSDATIKRRQPRVEHFGFRDGISQPFVDLSLKIPLPGGGRPAKDGSWAPVAKGEIFLGPPDEDGLKAAQPINEVLRNGGTYLVFRKLEQDVAGFNAFLESQREGAKEQERLAAQIVGRWKSGAPLVRHPHSDANYDSPQGNSIINDFRYFAEDPHGQKCPLGAHVRRANPRDTGGRDQVKRHRLLRRGMSYGGPLLTNSTGDGRRRGLLFMAANSRLELQFELIQRDWLNGGELLGQVGLGRCPLTGANGGGARDEFLEAGAVAPLSGIPSFVTTKGGDYFFVPSVTALDALANETSIEPGKGLFGTYSSSIADTPALLSEAALKAHAKEILWSLLPRSDTMEEYPKAPPRSAIRVKLPPILRESGDDIAAGTMVFVGRYDDVAEVLGGHLPVQCQAMEGQPRTNLNFSVAHYLEASRVITRGENLLLAMDPNGPLDGARRHRLKIMREAWQKQSAWTDLSNGVLRKFIRETVDGIEQRVAHGGQIDILQDLAFYIPYRILQQFVGISGPEHFSELVVALPYAKRHITQLPADWLARRRGEIGLDPGYATIQMWSRLAFAEVIGNIWRKRELTAAAIQATSEMLSYIDETIARERLRQAENPEPPKTLLAQLVSMASDPSQKVEFSEVRAILADIVTTISMNIALPFSKAVQGALEFRFDLGALLGLFEDEAEVNAISERLAYELLRLFPSAPAIFRRCEVDTTLPSGAKIQKGEWVAALLAASGRDHRFFPCPNKFSLGEASPSALSTLGETDIAWPERKLENYLLFGPACGAHRCWGEPLGRLVIGEMFQAAARFPGLTRVAGQGGNVVEFPPRMDYGLRLKFNRLDPNRTRGRGGA